MGYDFECPSVFKLDGRWYLVAICGAHDRSVYRVAERIEGPWRRPCDDAITPGQNQSLRPCRFKGRMHLFHWTRGPRDWNAYRGGGHYSAVASPKEAWADETGALHLKSCDWSPLYRGEPRPLPADPGSAGAGTWKASGGGLAGDSEFGTGVWVSQAEHEDFELRAEFKADPSRPAREFGFALRTDEHGDQGVFAGLVPGRFEAQLVKVVNNHRHGPQSLWRGRSVIQRYHVPAPPDGVYRLRLIAWGPSVELTVNDRLALHALTLPRRRGRVGAFLEDGGGRFESFTLQPLSAPTCNWEE